jgi:cytidylate kinase
LKKITIAIDGFSSTGKSTLAKELAKHLGYVYVDTGAMYRAVALFAMENDCIASNFFDSKKLIKKLPQIELLFKWNEKLGFSEMYLNGKNVENKIRSIEVSSFVSKVAAVAAVRSKLVEQQQEMGKSKGIVMDGRDVGTVIFPDAELKIFMTATAEIRTKRRFEELQQKGEKVSYEVVFENIQERDTLDTNRKDAPLIKATDAVLIDNSLLSKEAQFELVVNLVNTKLETDS